MPWPLLVLLIWEILSRTELINPIFFPPPSSLEETAHLFRSPVNSRRLLAALQRALASEAEPQSLSDPLR